MKVVITGGGGFIGSHAAEYMARKGNEVVVVDNLSRAALLKSEFDVQYNWKYLTGMAGIKLVEGDILGPGIISEEVADCDAIIHTAAQTAVTSSLIDPITDMRVNVIGTVNVLEAARKARTNPSLIFCSTNKVYGDNINSIPIQEAHDSYRFAKDFMGIPEDFSIDRTGHTPYGASKLAADVYVQDYAHTYGLNTIVFRMSCIYGTRQFGVEDQGWVAWFAIATILGEPITIYGDGKQVRDVLFVDDLIRAFDLAIMNSKSFRGEVFNIGGGPRNTLSLLNLLELLENLTGETHKLNFSDWRPHDQKVYVSDIRKAREKLGWVPEIGSREGITRVLKWIQTNKSLFQSRKILRG